MTYENIMFAVLYLLTGGLIIYAIKYAKGRAKEIDSVEVKRTVDYVLDVVSKVVGAFNQTVVNQAKEDGTFNRENAQAVKAKAMDRINEILSETSKDILNKGISNIDAFLDDAVEAEVRKQKNK